MNKNTIIANAMLLCRVIFYLLIAFFAGFIIVLLHSSFSPETYQNWVLTEAFKAGWGIGEFRICEACGGPNDVVLGEMPAAAKWWLGLRGTLFFVLMALIIRTFIKIINSVKSLNTFYRGNIQHFRQLARYGGLAFLLSAFNFSMLGGSWQLHLTLPFGPLLFTAACLVLAEVFREGEALAEDKASIV